MGHAVASSRQAFESWSKTPGHVRARYLYAIARHIQKHHRIIAVVESLDNGKPIRETRDCDIPIIARWFYHYAGWAQVCSSDFSFGRVGFLVFLVFGFVCLCCSFY